MENNLFAPASENQINALKRMGYTGSLEGLTMAEASELIRELNQKRLGINQGQQAAPQQNTGYQGYTQPQQPQYQPQPQNNQMAKIDTSAVAVLEVADDLMANLTELANDGMLFIPENYSVGNALKSAISKIMTSEQADLLLACTPESKKQALTEYVVQGLDASKNQAYFMPVEIKKKGADGKKYGTGQYQMVMMRSYFGDAMVVKRTGLVEEPYAVVIYKGDEVEIGFDEKGRKTLISHKTKFENQDNEIIGAYACLVGVNGYKYYEFMTRKELEASWSMSKNYGDKNKLQNQFTQEAAKRTVIRRAVKVLFNSSENTTEEQTALIGSYTRTTEDEYDDSTVINAEVKNSTTEEVKVEQTKKTASKKINPENDEDWLNENND